MTTPPIPDALAAILAEPGWACYDDGTKRPIYVWDSPAGEDLWIRLGFDDAPPSVTIVCDGYIEVFVDAMAAVVEMARRVEAALNGEQEA